jgi:cytosine/adenosine deaminase-related metal-dependent hydrolase
MADCPVAGVLGPDGHAVSGPATISVDSGVITGLRTADRASTLVAMPPLVNSHDHGRGLGLIGAGVADGPLETWLGRLATDGRTQTDLVGNAARQMTANGIGAAVFCVNPGTSDVESELEEACAAAASSGIRAALVVPFADTAGRMRGRADRADDDVITRGLAMVERLAARAPGVEWQIGPVGPQWVTERALAVLNESALAEGRRLHMHLLESPAQRAWADEVYPEGLLAWLDQLGVLGPHACFAHGTQLRADELALMAERGCSLAVNASSNLRLCSGFAPVAEAAVSGVDVAVGLDGLSLNEDNDPWTELRLLRGIAQAQTHQSASAAEILAMGFNSTAMGGQRPNPVATGADADLLVVDIGRRAQLLARADWSLADVVLAAPVGMHALWVDGRALHLPTDPCQPVPLTVGDLT